MKTNIKQHQRHAWIALAIAVVFGSVPVQAASPVNQYEYDANGNLTKSTDGLSNATTQQYDALNRLNRQNQANPSSSGQLGQINIQSNAVDGVTNVSDPRSLSTTYTRNAFGQILSQTSPDTGATTFTYDNAGNLKTKTDARGKTTTYSYDAANRLIASTGGQNFTYAYDEGVNGKGRLTGMTYGNHPTNGSTSWSYDAQGRVIRKQSLIYNNNYDLQWQYDSVGHLTRMIYPSTRYVDYGYNSNGQINQLWVDGVAMLSNIQYHPTGAVKSWSWGNGQSYQRTLDADGRISSYTVGDKRQVLTYDNAGRITQLHRALNSSPNSPIANTVSTYVYDNLGRLTSNVTSSSNRGYQYDLSGNRTQLTIGANAYPYGIASNSNRLLTEAGPGAREYEYDAAGNITWAGESDDTAYSYYNDGRLFRILKPNATYTSLYNGLGQRTAFHLYRYVYDETGKVIGEYLDQGDLVQETVYLGDIPVLTLRPSPDQRTGQANSNAGGIVVTATGAWAGDSIKTHAATASTTDKIVYSFTPPSTQSYRVYARWTATAGNASNAQYTVHSNTAGSSATTVNFDQTQNDGAWNYLGSYSLNAAHALTVTLSGQGNGAVVADAIRIVPAATASVQSIAYNVYTDHLNTPREIRDHANQQRWTWYPEQAEGFGANLPNENPASVGSFTYNLRFPGQIYHAASQNTYNYFRDYEPRTGRYIQSDPIGLEGGINTYAYVGGNPLSFIDPLGNVRQGGDTGKWWEFTDRDFQRWFHQCIKGKGDPDATREELAAAYAEWLEFGKPNGKNGCGGPPPPAIPVDSCGETCQKSATVIVVGGSSYVVYRCLRMLPSLLPPFWPSIPANVVLP